jgi:hypothetical protein
MYGKIRRIYQRLLPGTYPPAPAQKRITAAIRIAEGALLNGSQR